MKKTKQQLPLIKQKMVTLHLEPSLHKQARMHALSSELTLQQLITKAIEQYLQSQQTQ